MKFRLKGFPCPSVCPGAELGACAWTWTWAWLGKIEIERLTVLREAGPVGGFALPRYLHFLACSIGAPVIASVLQHPKLRPEPCTRAMGDDGQGRDGMGGLIFWEAVYIWLAASLLQ